jgi:hypothetical protein
MCGLADDIVTKIWNTKLFTWWLILHTVIVIVFQFNTYIENFWHGGYFLHISGKMQTKVKKCCMFSLVFQIFVTISSAKPHILIRSCIFCMWYPVLCTKNLVFHEIPVHYFSNNSFHTNYQIFRTFVTIMCYIHVYKTWNCNYTY